MGCKRCTAYKCLFQIWPCRLVDREKSPKVVSVAMETDGQKSTFQEQNQCVNKELPQLPELRAFTMAAQQDFFFLFFFRWPRTAMYLTFFPILNGTFYYNYPVPTSPLYVGCLCRSGQIIWYLVLKSLFLLMSYLLGYRKSPDRTDSLRGEPAFWTGCSDFMGFVSTLCGVLGASAKCVL